MEDTVDVLRPMLIAGGEEADAAADVLARSGYFHGRLFCELRMMLRMSDFGYCRRRSCDRGDGAVGR